MMAKARRRNGLARSSPTGAGGQTYVLRLYVAGLTARSRKAIENITNVCDEYLHGRYDLEVIDIFKRPVLAREEQIFATPTLVKKLPAPLRRFIGDLSEREKILVGLDLRRQG
jgi:circadian clock protein KaiB